MSAEEKEHVQEEAVPVVAAPAEGEGAGEEKKTNGEEETKNGHEEHIEEENGDVKKRKTAGKRKTAAKKK